MKQVKSNKLRNTTKARTNINQIDERLLTSNRISVEEDSSLYNLLQLIVSFDFFAFNTKLLDTANQRILQQQKSYLQWSLT